MLAKVRTCAVVGLDGNHCSFSFARSGTRNWSSL